MDGVEVAGKPLIVLWLGGELQLAGPSEIAVDPLLGDDPLDGVDASRHSAWYSALAVSTAVGRRWRR